MRKRCTTLVLTNSLLSFVLVCFLLSLSFTVNASSMISYASNGSQSDDAKIAKIKNNSTLFDFSRFSLRYGPYTLFYVFTPNNTQVSVKQYTYDYTTTQINYLNSTWDQISNSDTRLYTATQFFNCHSYAWYSQNTSANHYWMDNPKNYYSDGSYSEVTYPQKGDIICYFDNNGTQYDPSDDINLHSGIVVYAPQNSTGGTLGSLCIIESKWGGAGLYRHNGYRCPYTHYMETLDLIELFDFEEEDEYPENQMAEYVKYYRRNNHIHYFNTYDDYGDDNYHKTICNCCGMIIHEQHNWVEIHSKSICYIPEFHCTECGAVTFFNVG